MRYTELLNAEQHFSVWGLSANRLVLKFYGEPSGFKTYTFKGRAISNTVITSVADVGDDEGGGDHFGFFSVSYNPNGDIVVNRYRY